MRTGGPAVRERSQSRADPRGRRLRRAVLDQGADRLRDHVRRCPRQLEISGPRKPRSQRPRHVLAARPSRGRVELHQCPGVLPRDAGGFRRLADAGKSRLGLGRGASVLREIRAARGCRWAGAHRRAARRQGCHPLSAPDAPGMARSCGRAQTAGHRRLQRPASRRLRLLPGLHPQWASLVGRAMHSCVPR